MAVSVVQRNSGQAATGTLSVAFTSNITAGNAIVVVCASGQTMPPNPTDTLSSGWTLVTAQNDPDSNGYFAWVKFSSGGGADTVSMVTNSNATSLFIYELAGVTSYDAISIIKASSTSNSITPAGSNDVLLGIVADDGTATPTITAGGSFVNQLTSGASGMWAAMAERIASPVSGSYSSTWTMTGNNGGGPFTLILSFADTSVPPPSVTITVLGSTFNTTSGTHTVVATPAVGSLIAIVTMSSGNTSTTTPTDSNSSGTYTSIVTALKNTSADIMTANVRTATIASAVSTTFTHAPGTSTGGGLIVYQITGASGTGATAVKQFASQANHASGSAPAPVFSSAVTTTNPVIAAVFNATNPSNIAPRSTPFYNSDMRFVGWATPTSGVAAMHIVNGETGTTITWGSSSASAFSSVALEFATSSATNASITQVAATLTASGGTQSITTVASASITQVAATITATGGTQSVASIRNSSIAQVAANLTASGGTQTLSTINIVSISQTAANITATGGTQVVTTGNIVNASVTQIAASITASGGTQPVTSLRTVSIAQSTATLTASGGTQSVSTIRNSSVTQTADTLTVTGGAQALGTVNNSSISQVAATITATGGTQTVATLKSASITQVAATITATSGTQAIDSTRSVTMTQVAATLMVTAFSPVIIAIRVSLAADELNIVTLEDTLTITQVETSEINVVSTQDNISIRTVEDSINVRGSADSSNTTSFSDSLSVVSYEDSLIA